MSPLPIYFFLQYWQVSADTQSSFFLVQVPEIAYGFGGPSEKMPVLINFYCKIPIFCQSLAKSSQICRSPLTEQTHFVKSALPRQILLSFF